MVKRTTKKTQSKGTGTSPKPIKKPKKKPQSDAEQEDSEEDSNSLAHDSSEFISSEEISDEDESSESSQISSVKPQNYAIKQMSFRSRRGTKMNYLINRKKQEEDDPFWQEQGAAYFGDLDDGDADEEEYSQSSSGKDIFDSDFGQTQSEHDDDSEQSKKYQDEEKQKQKKKHNELMKKINTKVPPKSKKKPQKQEEVGYRYIHQLFSQKQLLDEAAHTEYQNWLSLKRLISIETQKKDYTRKQRHLDGNKLIYRDKRNIDGSREVSYELSGIKVEKIQDLTDYWSKH